MAVAMLGRWAAEAPVPVFVARGGGSGLLAAELAADRRLVLVASPRHASVLLAAGRFPAQLGVALDRVHDQMPRPRRTIWWTADADDHRPPALGDATVVTGAGADPVPALVAAHRAACVDHGDGDPDVLADVAPNDFEGRGDHGQGGEGMMGGVPYGRPMAMTGDDRDGLALDELAVVLGPFLAGFPNGLQVRGVLQGGVVSQAEPVLVDLGAGPRLDTNDLSTPVGRARHDLRWLSDALGLGGLSALGARAAALARSGADAAERQSLSRRVRRSGLARTWAGVGVVDGADARDRLERVLGDPGAERRAPLSPERLGEVLVGQDWADAVVTICSLGLATDTSVAMSGWAS
ncbi:MAG: hypothetical protein M3066_00150 [Actinomycetota bacterium]|nr:hypothetical protein [Actinomycetota bacterium]